MVDWQEEWVEVFTLFFVVIGFIIAVALQNMIFSLLSIFLGGFLSARLYFFKKYKEPILPFILIIIGFLAGYLIGSVWVSRILILLFFALGFGLSYYLHLKEILVIFKSKNFVK